MPVASERRAPRGRTDDPWLSANDAAAYLGFAPRTLAWWRNPKMAGHGPKFVRTSGGIPRYRRSALDAWLKKQGRS